MTFKLMDLPYPKDALAPCLSAETLALHHGKHHAGYVDKLNKAITGTPHEGKSLAEVVKAASGGLFNNAAQVFNHDFYWNSMAPGGTELPGEVDGVLKKAFGSTEAFKKKFTEEALGHFGSGWAWLVADGDGKLAIETTHDAGCPIRDGKTPLLTCDVWEHAYYLDHNNRRNEYVQSWWEIVNWKAVGERLRKLGSAVAV